jgi:monoamine oxidase
VRGALARGCFGGGAINTAWVSNPYVAVGPAIVAGFVCGFDRSRLEDEPAALRLLDDFVGVVVGEPVTRIAGVVKDWTPDRWSLGITTTPGAGARSGYAAQLTPSFRRIHFAGDYTDPVHLGTMEGAVRSGERAADEVLRRPTRIPLTELEPRLVRP